MKIEYYVLVQDLDQKVKKLKLKKYRAVKLLIKYNTFTTLKATYYCYGRKNNKICCELCISLIRSPFASYQIKEL